MSWAFRRRSSTGWGKERMKKWSIGNLWKKYKYVGLVVLAGIVLTFFRRAGLWPLGTAAYLTLRLLTLAKRTGE